jgi:HSP20 family protein
MLMRFDPFRQFDRLTDTMLGSAAQAARSFPIDAYRRGDQFIVHMDLPGVDPGTIDLSVDRNVLTVRARREFQPQDGDEVIITERPQGEFTRHLFLGDMLDAENIQANYQGGVLTLTIPVAERAKPRQIPVNASGERPQEVQAGSATGGNGGKQPNPAGATTSS